MSRCRLLVLLVLCLLWVALCLALPAVVEAKPFCTNSSTGSDATAYASLTTATQDGNGTCTATIRRAADVALAGDIIYVAAGTYTTAGTANRFVSSLNPTNSGTNGNPIVFISVGTVNLGLSSSTGVIVGCSSRNYITWRGFVVHEANGTSVADTGSVVAHDSTGCIIEQMSINGNGTGHGQVDNHTGIRMEACVSCILRNNTITNVTSAVGTNAANGSAIMVYASDSGTIENNTISACGSGIYMKGGPHSGTRPGFTIRYNLISNVTTAGLITYAGAPSTDANPTIWSQNIVRDAASGIRFWHFNSGFDDATYNVFVNNTIYNVTNGVEVLGDFTSTTANNVVRNNIVSVATYGILSTAPATYHQNTSRISHENNVYHSIATQHARLNADGSPVNVTLANWKLAPYTQDAASPAAITSDPQFVSTVTPDFHLQGGSPALTHGRAIRGVGGADGTTIPAGAYITGAETIGAGNDNAGAVRRLRIRGAD